MGWGARKRAEKHVAHGRTGTRQLHELVLGADLYAPGVGAAGEKRGSSSAGEGEAMYAAARMREATPPELRSRWGSHRRSDDQARRLHGCLLRARLSPFATNLCAPHLPPIHRAVQHHQILGFEGETAALIGEAKRRFAEEGGGAAGAGGEERVAFAVSGGERASGGAGRAGLAGIWGLIAAGLPSY